jgi:hypothetical protein
VMVIGWKNSFQLRSPDVVESTAGKAGRVSE